MIIYKNLLLKKRKDKEFNYRKTRDLKETERRRVKKKNLKCIKNLKKNIKMYYKKGEELGKNIAKLIIKLEGKARSAERLAEYANKNLGWNGVENSKILENFIINYIEDSQNEIEELKIPNKQ